MASSRPWPAGIRVVGLTGGIASGKSTVSAMLREAGLPVVDADRLAREVVAPGTPGLAEVAAAFPGVIAADATLDRVKLGAQVFSDEDQRKRLNGILHPRIQQLAREEVGRLSAAGNRVAVYDAPLIVENGLQALLDGLIVVSIPEDDQVRRLCARNGFTEAEARARIASQLPLAEKLRHATWIVDNSGSLDETREQVTRIVSELRTPS